MTSRSEIKRLVTVGAEWVLIKRIEALESALEQCRKHLKRPQKPSKKLVALIDELLEIKL